MSVLRCWSSKLVRLRPSISKSVYGAAIVSVLGTSVAVYSSAFSERKHPLEGLWEIEIKDGDVFDTHSLIMMFSDQSKAYWGYSDFRKLKDSAPLSQWISVKEFDPSAKSLRITRSFKDEEKNVSWTNFKTDRDGRLYFSDQSSGEQSTIPTFRLVRRN
jgi:hypothetical protein